MRFNELIQNYRGSKNDCSVEDTIPFTNVISNWFDTDWQNNINRSHRTCMAKSITARKSEVLRFIDTHGYALYCLINQINRNSSITNSHHIQKILEKAKIKSKYSEKWWPQVGLLFPYSLHNFSITSNCCWVIWINSDLFLFKDTKSCLKLLLYLEEYALQQILITSKSQVSTKKIRQLSKTCNT